MENNAAELLSREKIEAAMATTGTTRGPYAKTLRVREGIIHAAAEAFAELGYRATTMKEIAARAGISEGGLVHHFSSKDDLLAVVLALHETRAAERVPFVGGLEALFAMIDIVAEDSREPHFVELHATLSAEATSAAHPAHHHYTERYAGIRRYATQAFEVLERQQMLTTSLAPAQLGAAFVALLDGLQLQWLYEAGAVDPRGTLEAFIRSVVEVPQ